MEFPEDILKIIKEYAKPVTRPDWRRIHRMTDAVFYRNLSWFQYNEDNFIYPILRIKKIYIELDDTGFHLLKVSN